MINEVRCSGNPPAARSAATTLPAATSNCSAMVSPSIVPSRACAVCPPRWTVRPGAATTACAKPTGSASSGAVTIRCGVALIVRSRSSPGPLGAPARGPGRVELGVVGAAHQQRLGDGLQLDGAAEVHVELAGEQHL